MSTVVKHLSRAELEAGLANILESPRDAGELALIVQRPATGERKEVNTGELSVSEGLVGDNWKARGSGATPDRSAHPDMQLNIMNSRAIALIAVDPGRQSLAGDQLYVDMDLSEDNLSPGSRLQIGAAIVEVTDVPHTGCRKFVQRFGRDAMEFVNSDTGRKHNLRGINARVVQQGPVRLADPVVVLRRGSSA
jgi:MOSC domain-containing protein YiiM